MTVKIKLSNIVYLKKQVKDYAKPFRFTITLLWEEPDGREHGVDIVGCLGGVGKDNIAEWRGPMFWIGRKVNYSAHFMPGTYEKVLRALEEGGYFKYRLQDLLPEATRAVPAEIEYGLPGELNVG